MRRCPFCRSRNGADAAWTRLPARRMAYETRRQRVWAICERCGRWNLLLPENRGPAIAELERIARDEAHAVAATANATLLETADRTLLRIGRTTLPERAWWRYGRVLRRRRADAHGRAAAVSSLTYGALAHLGEASGLIDRGLRMGWADDARTGILRWRRFATYAWRGRTPCPYCGSVLCALRFDLSWWLYPRARDGRIAIGVPCPRCDPWTLDKVFTIADADALLVMRRVLAWQLIDGAGDESIARAAAAIRHAGSARALLETVLDGRRTLRALGPTLAVAVEIAVNERAERHDAMAELRALEAAWRDEDELAGIIDEVLG